MSNKCICRTCLTLRTMEVRPITSSGPDESLHAVPSVLEQVLTGPSRSTSEQLVPQAKCRVLVMDSSEPPATASSSVGVCGAGEQVIDCSEPLVTSEPFVVIGRTTRLSPNLPRSLTLDPMAFDGQSDADLGSSRFGGLPDDSVPGSFSVAGSPRIFRYAPRGPGSPSERRFRLSAAEIKNQWNLWKVFEKLNTHEACVKFADEKGLLQKPKRCHKHKKDMVLSTAPSHGHLGVYRCTKKDCKSKPIRRAHGTWFEHVRLPLPKVFQIMYMFCQKYTFEQVMLQTISDDRNEVLSIKTIGEWYNKCRETIAMYESEHQESRSKIGGIDKIVHIDECKIDKRKNNRANHVEGDWILGMVEDGSYDLRLEVCPENVSSEVLMPIIQKHVAEGSIIQTDFWGAYDCLPQYGYIHKKVYHSDPEGHYVTPHGTPIQKIQSNWRGLKRKFSIDRYQGERYQGEFWEWLLEYNWRRKVRMNREDIFLALIKAIHHIYGQGPIS